VLRDRGGRDRVGGGDGRPTGCDGIKRNRIRNPARTKIGKFPIPIEAFAQLSNVGTYIIVLMEFKRL
jgi:hypothetical protein